MIYWTSMFGHQNVPEKFRIKSECWRVTGTPRGVNGPYWALVEDRRRRPGGGRPPKPNPNWGGGPGPPFLLSFPPFLPSPTPTREGGILLPPGVGLPPWACHERTGSPPPPHLYIWGRGHPIDTQVDCLAMCGAPLHRFPPRSYRHSA